MSDTDVATLRNAVQQLNLTQRRVLVLHYAEELSIDEIALVLDMSEALVESTLSELRDMARRELGEAVGPEAREGQSALALSD